MHRVWWDEDARVARSDWLPGSVATIKEAEEQVNAIQALGRGKVPLLVDMRQMSKFERSARERFINERGTVTAVALLTGSPVTRMMANFFIGARRLPVPIQMFNDKSAALAWLQGSELSGPS